MLVSFRVNLYLLWQMARDTSHLDHINLILGNTVMQNFALVLKGSSICISCLNPIIYPFRVPAQSSWDFHGTSLGISFSSNFCPVRHIRQLTFLPFSGAQMLFCKTQKP